ncbi:uncharacterized protein LOC132047547 [Lycium ferocissimum]|uniref:uncharacterized protein LOC132047547 n=1 Tax=Lycium ferocissimum TaxID=112874 RepID=UPI0028156ADD|nr:uncharacterized protein LOC132047547 [Lycium ferocissimum]
MDFSSSCFCHSQISLKMNCRAPALVSKVPLNTGRNQPAPLALREMKSDLSSQRLGGFATKLSSRGSSLGGSRIIIHLHLQTLSQRKSSRVSACWLPSSEIASTAFTVGTAAVLPFYTIMVVAPKAELTRKATKSSIPYIVLGLLYAYLLCLSWTPDTIRLMFASKYWLPEVCGQLGLITKGSFSIDPDTLSMNGSLWICATVEGYLSTKGSLLAVADISDPFVKGSITSSRSFYAIFSGMASLVRMIGASEIWLVLSISGVSSLPVEAGSGKSGFAELGY